MRLQSPIDLAFSADREKDSIMPEHIRIAKMNLKEALENSVTLAEQIANKGFEPTAVIGIATGGLVPSHVVSQQLDCPLVILKMARPMTGVKTKLGLGRLPTPVKHFLRRLEMSLGLYRILRKRDVQLIHGEVKRGRYVIVDDSLDTGNTMRVAMEYLQESAGIQPSDFMLASLTQIFSDAEPAADVCIFQNTNFEFPWSQDSPEHSLFLDYCREHLPL